MAHQSKARAKQFQRLNKPKKPVVLLRGNKRKPKAIILPGAGIPAGLAGAARRIREKAKQKAKEKTKKEFDSAGKVGVSERSILE